MKKPDAAKSAHEMREENLAMQRPFRQTYSKYLRNQRFEDETWEIVLSEHPANSSGPPFPRRFILRNKLTGQLFESTVSETEGSWFIQQPFEVEAKEVTVIVYERKD